MKLWSTFCFLLAFTSASLAQERRISGPAFAPVDPYKQVKDMGRGINILGYDAVWDANRFVQFQQKHFRAIKDAGFQTVRVNLFAFKHMDSNLNLNPKWLQTLDMVINEALAAGLIVILDEHDDKCEVDAELCIRALTRVWTQLSERYRDAPASVLFEVLNEPGHAITPAIWNKLWSSILPVIRATNPTRNVILGPAEGYRYELLSRLELPENDRHLIVTIHYYRPFDFTHQKASWDPKLKSLPARSWGSEAEKRQLAADFDAVNKWSIAHRRPIFLGEFGVYDAAEMNTRAAYLSAVTRRAEALGWAWAYWQFEPDFKAYDMSCGCWIEPVRKALMGEGRVASPH